MTDHPQREVAAPVPARPDSREKYGYMSYPKNPLLLIAYRAPIFWWRLGLGPVLGQQFALITTTGRRSGKPRRAVVEYFRLGHRKYIYSAYGSASDWYKNVQVNPCVTVQTAAGTESAFARRMTDPNELVEVLQRLRETRPLAARQIFSTFELRSLPDDIYANRGSIYLLALDPTDEYTPQPLEVDLWWVGPLALAAAVLGWRIGRLFAYREPPATSR